MQNPNQKDLFYLDSKTSVKHKLKPNDSEVDNSLPKKNDLPLVFSEQNSDGSHNYDKNYKVGAISEKELSVYSPNVDLQYRSFLQNQPYSLPSLGVLKFPSTPESQKLESDLPPNSENSNQMNITFSTKKPQSGQKPSGFANPREALFRTKEVKKITRGLKSLTVIVCFIMQKDTQYSLSELAELAWEYSKRTKIDSKSEENEITAKQNIRRRVYEIFGIFTSIGFCLMVNEKISKTPQLSNKFSKKREKMIELRREKVS